MPHSREETTSVWQDATLLRGSAPVLSAARELSPDTQVCVVGAGIAGLTTAYLLQRAGAQVQVLDAAPRLCAGETGRTTAHLSSVLDDDFCELERLFEPSGARLAASSHAAAIDCIEAIVQAEGIQCDFERLDGLLVAAEPAQRARLEKESDALRRARILRDAGAALAAHRGHSHRWTRVAISTAGGIPRRTVHAWPGAGLYRPRQALVFDSRAVEVKGGSSAHVRLESGARLGAQHRRRHQYAVQ